jgi:endonuclease YncB( thermonuclease family)
VQFLLLVDFLPFPGKKENMKNLLLSALAVFLLSSPSIANDVKGKVIAVIDGNTFKVRSNDNQIHKILLVGIDSPELGQEFGREAKKFLEKMILGKTVTISFRGSDRNGNPFVEVRISGTKDPRIELLKEGLAWTTGDNPPQHLEQYRATAQLRNKGLWRQSNPTPPWIYRQEQNEMNQKSI